MSGSQYTIQPVRPQDVPAVVSMVHELAEFERAPDKCHLTAEQLHAALFGQSPALFGHVAFDPAGEPVGIMLWFLNFSTWEGQHGIYLEDLYVRPHARGTGLGPPHARYPCEALRRAWISAVGSGGCCDWNPARDFYVAMGSEPMDEWVTYRMTGTALTQLAANA